MAGLLGPIGFGCEPRRAGRLAEVTVPTIRPDVAGAHGVDDVIEEVARTYGYSRCPAPPAAWPEPGGLTDASARAPPGARGAGRAGRPRGLDPVARGGRRPPAGRVERPGGAGGNPCSRRGLLRQLDAAGLLRALAFNADRRQGDLASSRSARSSPARRRRRPGRRRRGARAPAGPFAVEREPLGRSWWPRRRRPLAVGPGRAGRGAPAASSAWWPAGAGAGPAPHPFGAARGRARRPPGPSSGRWARSTRRSRPSGRAGRVAGGGSRPLADRRDRAGGARPVSRYPSSDVDLALVVDDAVPADRWPTAPVRGATSWSRSRSSTCTGVHGLPRAPAASPSASGSAPPDRTLTDEEVGELRSRCIAAAQAAVGAVLR